MSRTKFLLASSLFAVTLSGLVGCKGDPKSPEYWDKQISSAHRPRDKVRVLEDLRGAGVLNASFRPLLVQHMSNDKSSEVRGELAKMLGDIKDPGGVDALVDALDMGSTDSAGNTMNKEIAGALGKIGDPKAIPTLMRLLKGRDPYVRIEAINALGALKAKQAVDPLIDIAQDEQDQNANFLAKKAIQALGEIGDPKPIPLLLKYMFKERRGVSFYPESSFALFQIGQPASDALMALIKGNDKETWGWVKENQILEPAVYFKSAQVLGDLQETRAEGELLKQLAYKNAYADLQLSVRAKAADSLGRMRAKGAVKPLSGMVEEPEANARTAYARALAMIGGRDGVPALLKSAAKGSWDARDVSMYGIAMLGDDRELGAFEKFVAGEEKLSTQECKDPDYAPKGCDKPAEWAKAHVGTERGYMKRLEAAKECKSDASCWVKKLDDADAGVRERAALEIGRSGKGELVTDLLKHTKDANLDARSAIIQAADWLILGSKQAVSAAQASEADINKQLDDEHGKTDFVKVNEDLRRLAVDLHRRAS